MATILIVEDDKLFRWAVKEALIAAGFNVLEARNGIEARRRFAEDVDLAILDYHLPDTTGFRLLGEMREARMRFPIVFLTAHATDDGATEAAMLGASHYASKPDDPGEVVRLVDRLLGTQRDYPQASGVFRA